MSGRDRITESLHREVSDSSELLQCRKKENYSLRNGRRQKGIDQMGLRVAEKAICGLQAHARTSGNFTLLLRPCSITFANGEAVNTILVAWWKNHGHTHRSRTYP